MKGQMPVLFVGHGSPMNAIEDNQFTKGWSEITAKIPKPKAILAVSAHWYTDGSRITSSPNPKMVYDMYGFPEALYKLQYNAKGAPELAEYTKNLITREIRTDDSWGYDHGTWSVLCKMYPEADIPVYQLSVDKTADPQIHFQIGQELRTLRNEGVLIFASGNVVHNLGKVNWELAGGYPWAEEFDNYITTKIIGRQVEDVVEYKFAGKSAQLSVPIPDHFFPLLYALGASAKEDSLTIFNDTCVMGSLSMTSYLWE